MKLDNKQLEAEAITVLNQELELLDSHTLHRLRNARVMALSQQQRTFGISKKHVKWITGASASLAIASILILMIVPNVLQSNQLSPFDDIEMLTTEADMDVVNQLEFYEWLDESLHEGS